MLSTHGDAPSPSDVLDTTSSAGGATACPTGELLSRDQLSAVRGHMIKAVEILDGLIEQKGCLHEDRSEVSTMGGGPRKFYCHDCGKTIEEEWGDLGDLR